LSVRTRAAAPVDAEVTLSYLATGFDWQANYIAELSDDERRIKLFAWLTLGSQDETSFPNADTQAVAGRVNYTRAEVPPAEGGPLELRCWPSATTSDIPLEELQVFDVSDGEAIVVTGSRIQRRELSPPPAPVSAVAEAAMVAQQEELGDLKLYRIPEPVTVAAKSQKQVALLVRQGVQVREVYRTRLDPGDTDGQSATRYLVTRNRVAEGLGLPLPSGGLALFTRRDGRLFLSGQGRVNDRAIGDDVEIAFANSPSVQSRVEQVRSDPNGRWIDYRLTVSNDQRRPIRLEVEFARPDDTRLVPGTRLTERDGYPLWTVTVPANGTATLRYRVEQLGKR
jgi:hypothetical protein